MSADPRAALSHLIAALERHLEASARRRGEDDPVVVAAYDDLADAFEAYDAALYDAYGEMTPMDIYGGSDEDDFDDDEDDDEDDERGDAEGIDAHDDEDGDDDHLYAGLAVEGDIEDASRG